MNLRNALRTATIIGCTLLSTGESRAAGISLFNSYWSPADFDAELGPGIELSFPLDDVYQLSLRASLFPDMGKDVFKEEERIEVDLEVLPLEAAFIANIPYVYEPLAQTYIGGGFGYYKIDLNARGPAGAIDYNVDDEIGFFLLAGVRMYITPELTLFGEANYRIVDGNAKTKQEDGTTSQIGMKLNGLGASVGIGLLW